MKILFDSSILIAAIIEPHPKHAQALSWLIRAKDNEFDLIVSAHSLLEVYSVLTKAPFQPNITPETAKRLIDVNIKKNATIQCLDESDYFNLLDTISSQNLKGGIVYDALIYACAKKSKVQKIVTYNIKDFSQINIDDSIEIISL